MSEYLTTNERKSYRYSITIDIRKKDRISADYIRNIVFEALQDAGYASLSVEVTPQENA